MKLKYLLTASVLAISAIANVQAANALTTNTVVTTTKAVPVVSELKLFSWTGPYAGLNIGYDRSDDFVQEDLMVNEVLGVRSNKALLGGFFGYGFDFGGFIASLEGGVNYIGFGLGDGTLYGADTVTMNPKASGRDWEGDLRVRVGYAMDRALLFVAAGPTYNSESDLRGKEIDGKSKDMPFDQGGIGFTIGAGIDYAFAANSFVRLEYRYNKVNLHFNDVAEPYVSDTKAHEVRLGIAAKY